MQTAKLKLPVEQFHRLYDFLGEVLDYYGQENSDFNMENSEINFIEGIRSELFHQIPDEKPIETTYAYTVHKDAHQITPIKLYETRPCPDGGFLITNDRGTEVFCINKGCSHLSSDKSKDWKFLTINND